MHLTGIFYVWGGGDMQEHIVNPICCCYEEKGNDTMIIILMEPNLW